MLLSGIADGVCKLQITGAGLEKDKTETKYGRQDNKVEYDMSGVLLKKKTKSKQTMH